MTRRYIAPFPQPGRPVLNNTNNAGRLGEKQAVRFLRKQRLKLIETNYRSRFGEIDAIMRDGDYLVFVEVRYRKNKDYGGALESITAAKQHKLRRTAETWLMTRKITDVACRFDILVLENNLLKPSIQWLKNAF